MTPFFVRLTFAIRTFVGILFRDHIPSDVAAALMPASPSVAAGGAPGSAPNIAVRREEEATAAQMLALLQRDGRLIDFLMENITAYRDEQIGAAVRSVHAGCRQALDRYVSLAPALDAQEGAHVTVDASADAARIKLIGNVSGQPPFTGVLNHRGWIVNRMELPPLAATGRQVIAPAEVELA
jgi:hypothetical protein